LIQLLNYNLLYRWFVGVLPDGEMRPFC